MNTTQSYIPRLKTHYESVVVKELVDAFGYTNPMQTPKIEKVVVNMGVGEAASDSKLINNAVANLTVITGQQPVITKAKQSISFFDTEQVKDLGEVFRPLSSTGQRHDLPTPKDINADGFAFAIA